MQLPFVLFLALTVVGQGTPRKERIDVEARAKVVAPYLDEQTIIVGRVDTTRLDVEAIAAKLQDLGRLDAKEMAEPVQLARRWLGGFKKAGGKEIYFLVNLADFPHFIVILVPLGPAADAPALIDLFTNPGGKKGAIPPGGPVAEQLGQVLAFGQQSSLERLRKLQPIPRPEVVEAFAHAGDLTAQLLLVPTKTTRRVLEETLRTLPKEWGGGPVTVLTRGVQWAALGINAPPHVAVNVTVRSQDAAAAAALRDFLPEALAAIGKEAEVQRVLPNLEQIKGWLKPSVTGAYLRLALDEPKLSSILTPALASARKEASRMVSANNLKQIGLAFHNYYTVYNTLPAAASYDKNGQPLLSWRVHLLPYLEGADLYKQFHLDEPWDSDHNKRLIAQMPIVYCNPWLKGQDGGKTSYLAPIGPATMFPGTKGIRFQDVVDGTVNTIFIVEADAAQAVPWTKPDDWKFDPKQPKAGLAVAKERIAVLFVDGSVRFLEVNIDPKDLAAMFTRNGGEVIQLP